MNEQMMLAGTDEGTAITIIREQAAKECHERVMRSAKLAVESFIDYAQELKRIRDNKYYLELGFEDFDSYTKQYFDISDGQASKYITVLDNKGRLPEELFSPGRRIEISKLYLLTTLDDQDREEFLSTHEDIDDMSKAEMESEIKELKERYKRLEEESQMTFESLEHFKNKVYDAKADLIRAKEESNKIIAEKEKIQKDLEQIKKVKANLERRIKKLENAEPVKETITVTDETEIKRLKGELEKSEKQIKALQTELDNVEKPEQVVRDEVEIFKAYLSPVVRGVGDLIKFINEHESSEHRSLYLDKVKALKAMLSIGGDENEADR